MEINVQATMGNCNQFMDAADSRKKEVSVVISPLKVITNESGDRLQVNSGCNLWRSCFNKDCWYSIAAREKK